MIKAVAWTAGYCRGTFGSAIDTVVSDATEVIGQTTDVINKVGDAGAAIGGKAMKFAMSGADEAEREVAVARDAAKNVARAALNLLQ